MLPTESTPTEATIVAVVTATLNAGAVPATPMTTDSNVPSDSFASSPSFNTMLPWSFAIKSAVQMISRLEQLESGALQFNIPSTRIAAPGLQAMR